MRAARAHLHRIAYAVGAVGTCAMVYSRQPDKDARLTYWPRLNGSSGLVTIPRQNPAYADENGV
jgi:hypothetical protein